jgi:hypothetical protein
VRALLEEAEAAGIELDPTRLGYAAQRALEALAGEIVVAPGRVEDLDRLRRLAELVRGGRLAVDLRRVENAFYAMARDVRPAFAASADGGDPDARRWLSAFDDLGVVLRVRRPDPASGAAPR